MKIKRLIVGGATLLIALALGTGIGFAGNSKGKGGNGGGTQDRKRDGSCTNSYILNQERQNLPALAKTQQRDRKKDNSCKS